MHASSFDFLETIQTKDKTLEREREREREDEILVSRGFRPWVFGSSTMGFLPWVFSHGFREDDRPWVFIHEKDRS